MTLSGLKIVTQEKGRSKVWFLLVLLSKLLQDLVQSTTIQTPNQHNGTDGDL